MPRLIWPLCRIDSSSNSNSLVSFPFHTFLQTDTHILCERTLTLTHASHDNSPNTKRSKRSPAMQITKSIQPHNNTRQSKVHMQQNKLEIYTRYKSPTYHAKVPQNNMIYQSIINFTNTTNLLIQKYVHIHDHDKLHSIHTKSMYITVTRTNYSSMHSWIRTQQNPTGHPTRYPLVQTVDKNY